MVRLAKLFELGFGVSVFGFAVTVCYYLSEGAAVELGVPRSRLIHMMGAVFFVTAIVTAVTR